MAHTVSPEVIERWRKGESDWPVRKLPPDACGRIAEILDRADEIIAARAATAATASRRVGCPPRG